MKPVRFTPPPAKVKEEPSYMMFARANARDGVPSSPLIVEKLLERIDRLEREKTKW